MVVGVYKWLKTQVHDIPRLFLAGVAIRMIKTYTLCPCPGIPREKGDACHLVLALDVLQKKSSGKTL